MDTQPPSYAESSSAPPMPHYPTQYQAEYQPGPFKYPSAAVGPTAAAGTGGPPPLPVPVVTNVHPQATISDRTTITAFATGAGPPSNLAQYGALPVQVVCASCRQFVSSRTTFEPGSFTYLCSLGVALLCLPCACVPCCLDRCKDVYHYCPNCNAQLGFYKRL